MLFINKTTVQRGETVTSANPTETVPSIKHLQFRFQHASLYTHVPSDKKHLSTPKEKKRRSHLRLCSAEGLWPSSCCCPQEPFARSPAGGEVGEFTPKHSISATAPHATISVWMHPRGHSWASYCIRSNFLKVKARISSCIFICPCVVQTSLPYLWVGDLLLIPSAPRPVIDLLPSTKNLAVVKLLRPLHIVLTAWACIFSTISSQLYISICRLSSLSETVDNLTYGTSFC